MATAVVVALAVASLAGCADNTDSEPVGTGTVAGTTPDTTGPPPTTSPPPTSDAPTTTLDEATQLAAQVEADLLEAFRLTDLAFLDPSDADATAAALEGHIGANRKFVAERLETFKKNGWAARLNPDVEPGFLIEVPAALVAPSVDVAELQACEVDSWVVVEPGAGPNGGEAVVDSNVYTYRSIFFLRLVDGRWRVEGSDQLGTWTGLGSCPAE
jgi:hypothetical protein